MEWLRNAGGIAHRDDMLRAGFTIALVREVVRRGRADLIRRVWVATPDAPDELRTAARAGARLTCVSLARRRGWWMPEGVGPELHLHLVPGSGSPRLADDWPGVTHWTKPLGPTGRTLVGGVEDALAHIALCLPHDSALVLWESAARVEGLAADALRGIPWTSRAACGLADEVTGLSDSGLESLVATPLRRLGLRITQQQKIAGRPVDLLVGDRLVIQIDGWQFHSSSAQRSQDIAHDAELRLRGYTVFRFAYAQVVHDWPAVESTIRRAVVARLHLAA
ncbi:DUF559 domain-containing protein [Microbacterium ulmi]|uniref:DUF559 domain-containing protein n=2 Tax=Microbacterium ulmi TaxID=179095 RepID=A0A7Y2Q1P4_9MICO|nr:DUF559 domain-containing protein [Microbacterium ulmi]